MRAAPTFSYFSGSTYGSSQTMDMRDWGIITYATGAGSTTGVWQVTAEL